MSSKYDYSTIKDIVIRIFEQKYILPAIQREFVWKVDQIETLFDSLMRGYPIGTFLFWDIPKADQKNYVFYYFLNKYHELKHPHNDIANLSGLSDKEITAVLDGQQRLTALYIALKGTYAYRLSHHPKDKPESYPERKLYLDLLNVNDESKEQKYHFAFLTKADLENSNHSHFWFEVGDILNFVVNDEMNDVRNFCRKHLPVGKNAESADDGSLPRCFTQEQHDFASDMLTHLYKVICEDGILSYYKIDSSAQLDKVLNIFVRVNSGGTPLSYSDLLLSIATAKWDGNAREEIIQLVDDINDIGQGFNFDKDFILKAALVLSDKKARFNVSSFRQGVMDDIKKEWDAIKEYITKAVELVSKLGFSGQNLTSNNAIIPIAYYLKQIEADSSFLSSNKMRFERRKIQQWLAASLIKGIFGSASDSALDFMREAIANNLNDDSFPLEAIIKAMQDKGHPITFTTADIETLLNLKYGKSSTPVLMFLYPNYNFSNGFAVDHIYPKGNRAVNKKLKAYQLTPEQTDFYKEHVNDLANLELLPAAVNGGKLDEDFGAWLGENYGEDESALAVFCQENYIPEMTIEGKSKDDFDHVRAYYQAAYSPARFENFLAERRKKLKTALENSLLRSTE